MKTDPTKLLPKQRLFVEEYLVDLCATQAAIRAGYSKRTAKQTSFELLQHPAVAAAIDAAMKQRETRSRVKGYRVLEEMAPLMESCVDHYRVGQDGRLELAEGAPPDAMKAVASVKYRTRTLKDRTVEHEVEFKLWDKPATHRLAAQHTGVAKDEPAQLVLPPGGIQVVLVRAKGEGE